MFSISKLILLAITTIGLIPVSQATAATLTGAPPIVIGHRGASGYRPEHTLEAYSLAISLGANYIEPDLVSTKDGVLIARHENAIAIVNPTTNQITEATTNVAEIPAFANRLTTKIIDGQSIKGWFTEDFTLAEIKSLRARERIPQLRPQNATFNDQFEVPTLQEVIDLAKQKSLETGRTIGIYPETKHPTYFDSPTYAPTVTPGNASLSLEEPLVQILNANGYIGSNAPVFVQSFEVGNLQLLNTLTDVPIVQLFGGSTQRPFDFVVSGDSRTYGDLATPSGLSNIATYASGIGPSKRLIVPATTVDNNGNGQPDDLNGDNQISDADRVLQTPTTLVDDAHAAGLLVHPYTFRNEPFFLASNYNNDPRLEYEQFYNLGVDGVFSDFPDAAVAAVPVPFEPSATLGLLLLGASGAVTQLKKLKKTGLKN